jgi:hypothetical protein
MTRYRSAWILLLYIVLLAGVSHKTLAQGTAFTYQGRLQDGGTNANGNYDFQFTLWDALTGGTQQPQPTPITVTRSNVTVVSGIFTVQLDFGATAFPGADRFLETGARLTGPGVFTILSPRQQITSTPYAIRSTSAGSADTAVNADQLGGVAANNYLQTVTHNLSLSGTGASNAALGVAVPLQLSGNFVGQGIISGINTNSAGAGVYGRSNLTNSGGQFSAGVFGENIGGGNGIYGVSNSSNDGFGGVFGQATNGDGVIGSGGRSGVFGFSTTGSGVRGTSGELHHSPESPGPIAVPVTAWWELRIMAGQFTAPVVAASQDTLTARVILITTSALERLLQACFSRYGEMGPWALIGKLASCGSVAPQTPVGS